MTYRPFIIPLLISPLSLIESNTLYAQDKLDSLSLKTIEVVAGGRKGTLRSQGIVQALSITQQELQRAACCNLGESFTTNPSVDVNYSDASTGARQVRLLGLSGAYVQLMQENIPSLRGLAQAFALGYVPGPWMQSIQVSKGSASVKNGYEGITGQINVEYLKPQGLEEININLYGDSRQKLEANLDGNLTVARNLSTGLMLHYEQDFRNHDDNHDGFIDKPSVKQLNIQNRWALMTPRYILQAGIRGLGEKRISGQTHEYTTNLGVTEPLYRIDIGGTRVEGFAKQAYFLDEDRKSNIALITSLATSSIDAHYGEKRYDAKGTNLYANLIYENNLTDEHNLSTGLSFVHDNYNQAIRTVHNPSLPLTPLHEHEQVLGAYAQYTYTLGDKFSLMGGLRLDHSNLHGSFVTPRLHLKYRAFGDFILRGSLGRGYRNIFALPELHYLLSSGRQLQIDQLQQEAAWTMGISAEGSLNLWGEEIKLNAEYYHSTFDRQVILDMDTRPDTYHVTNLNGKSWAGAMQVEASWAPSRQFNASVAYRWMNVYTSYQGELLERPLTNRYKGLISLSYRSPLEKWQVDATLQLNGGGRMPKPRLDLNNAPLWANTFPAYEHLNVQITRYFRGWSLYLGGENLTGRKQSPLLIDAHKPWGNFFDPTLVWGAVHGAMLYAGLRIKLTR